MLLLLLTIINSVYLCFVQPVVITNMMSYIFNLFNLKHLNLVKKILFSISMLYKKLLDYLIIHNINKYELMLKLNIIHMILHQFLPIVLCILLILTVNKWVKLVNI